MLEKSDLLLMSSKGSIVILGLKQSPTMKRTFMRKTPKMMMMTMVMPLVHHLPFQTRHLPHNFDLYDLLVMLICNRTLILISCMLYIHSQRLSKARQMLQKETRSYFWTTLIVTGGLCGLSRIIQ